MTARVRRFLTVMWAALAAVTPAQIGGIARWVLTVAGTLGASLPESRVVNAVSALATVAAITWSLAEKGHRGQRKDRRKRDRDAVPVAAAYDSRVADMLAKKELSYRDAVPVETVATRPPACEPCGGGACDVCRVPDGPSSPDSREQGAHP